MYTLDIYSRQISYWSVFSALLRHLIILYIVYIFRTFFFTVKKEQEYTMTHNFKLEINTTKSVKNIKMIWEPGTITRQNVNNQVDTFKS
jgi:hypothetical protein